jgi:hypothetical protein
LHVVLQNELTYSIFDAAEPEFEKELHGVQSWDDRNGGQIRATMLHTVTSLILVFMVCLIRKYDQVDLLDSCRTLKQIEVSQEGAFNKPHPSLSWLSSTATIYLLGICQHVAAFECDARFLKHQNL